MLRIRLASILALTAGAVLLPTACSDAPTTEASGEEHTGAAAQHWETKSTTSDHSTHVWVVERAIDLLGTKSTDESIAIRAILNDATCNTAWRQGLDDADYRHEYNDGDSDLWHDAPLAAVLASGATWKSHFYDPDTGLNYKGESSPTARTRANQLLSAAVSDLQAGYESQGCYELGLALHYMTDLTQPMHAVNFTNLDVPLGRHQDYENRAMDIQASVGTAPAIFDVPLTSPDGVLVAVAHESKGYWPALTAAFDSLDQANIDYQLRNNLWAAQVATARYLHAVGHSFAPPPPPPHLLPSDFKATLQNASRNGYTNECVIFSGSGQDTYPSRYLWGGGVDNGWCGFASKADLLANKQAVWTVTPLSGNRYAIANASAGGATNQCLIWSGNGQNTYPSRYLWGGGDNGACGLPSVNEELYNKQAVFTIQVLDACPGSQTQYGEWAGGFCCDGTVGPGGDTCAGTVCALDPARTQGLPLCPSVMP